MATVLDNIFTRRRLLNRDQRRISHKILLHHFFGIDLHLVPLKLSRRDQEFWYDSILRRSLSVFNDILRQRFLNYDIDMRSRE